METWDKLVLILKGEMVPALGVTEPAAIALACAEAYRAAAGGEVRDIRVITDPGVFKNCFSCTIPGTEEMGCEMAAILGVLAGDPELKLRVLENVTGEEVCKAKTLYKQGVAGVRYDLDHTDLYIEASVRTDRGSGRAIITETHANIVLIESNGEITYSKPRQRERDKVDQREGGLNSRIIRDLSLRKMLAFAGEIPLSRIGFIDEAVRMNIELAAAGSPGRWIFRCGGAAVPV